jgi:hypothetical protein
MSFIYDKFKIKGIKNNNTCRELRPRVQLVVTDSKRSSFASLPLCVKTEKFFSLRVLK